LIKAMLAASVHGDRDLSREIELQRLRHGRQTGDLRVMRSALIRLGMLSSVMGQLEDAALFSEELVRACLKWAGPRDEPIVHHAQALLSGALLELDHPERAEAQMAPVCAWLDSVQREGLPGFHAWLGRSMLRLYQGRYEEALDANAQVLAFEMARARWPWPAAGRPISKSLSA